MAELPWKIWRKPLESNALLISRILTGKLGYNNKKSAGRAPHLLSGEQNSAGSPQSDQAIKMRHKVFFAVLGLLLWFQAMSVLSLPNEGRMNEAGSQKAENFLLPLASSCFSLLSLHHL
ncbi:unnamed protein product [Notodromas monacha]|uniref:Uncharacterized protein n=1 Tax=Notodromas monacha TaxID=399045 RepID=A0A7R9BSS4_9CRUS|nr:unnamed protein product [Notodromas monacha]CAG0920737.1 unnamed protein product [Notodromas monacha]